MPVTISYSFSQIRPEYLVGFSANITSDANLHSPVITGLSGGGFSLSYYSVVTATGDYQMHNERHAINGDLLTGGVAGVTYINGPVGAARQEPVITQLASGGILTCWSAQGSLRYAITDPATGAVLSPDVALEGTGVNDSVPDIAALLNGGFVLVAQDSTAVNDSDADLQFYDATGDLVTTVNLGANSILDEEEPAVTVLSNGNVVVAYEKELVDNSNTFGMSVEIYTQAGAQVLGPTLFDFTGSQNRNPDIVALDSGGFAVGYTDNAYGGPGVTVWFFDADGTSRGSVRADTSGATTDVSLSVLANGYVVATWTDGAGEIYCSIIDPQSRTLLAGPIVIENQSGLQEFSAVAGLDNGTFVTAWVDHNTAIADGNTDPTGDHISLQINAFGRISTGDAANNVITGDALIDTIFGNAGNDTIDGGASADAMSGGLGNDIYYVDNALDTIAELSGAGSGSDFIYSSATYTMAANTERLFLTGTSNIDGTGLNGQADVLTGNVGNNILNGLTGNDVMRGGQGNDTYLVDAAGDVVEENTGYGTDAIKTAVSFTMSINTERLYLIGTAAIDGTGLAARNDLIVGNGAANKLNGLSGNDTLTGGLGADTFIFNTALNAATNHDTITDFNVAADTIQLENAIFTLLPVVGPMALAFFKDLSLGGQDANDVIIYDRANGDLYYDSNGIAAGGQILFADVTNNTALTFADFVVV